MSIGRYREAERACFCGENRSKDGGGRGPPTRARDKSRSLRQKFPKMDRSLVPVTIHTYSRRDDGVHGLHRPAGEV